LPLVTRMFRFVSEITVALNVLMLESRTFYC